MYIYRYGCHSYCCWCSFSKSVNRKRKHVQTRNLRLFSVSFVLYFPTLLLLLYCVRWKGLFIHFMDKQKSFSSVFFLFVWWFLDLNILNCNILVGLFIFESRASISLSDLCDRQTEYNRIVFINSSNNNNKNTITRWGCEFIDRLNKLNIELENFDIDDIFDVKKIQNKEHKNEEKRKT